MAADEAVIKAPPGRCGLLPGGAVGVLAWEAKAPRRRLWATANCEAVMPITLPARSFSPFTHATVPTQFLIVVC